MFLRYQNITATFDRFYLSCAIASTSPYEYVAHDFDFACFVFACLDLLVGEGLRTIEPTQLLSSFIVPLAVVACGRFSLYFKDLFVFPRICKPWLRDR